MIPSLGSLPYGLIVYHLVMRVVWIDDDDGFYLADDGMKYHLNQMKETIIQLTKLAIQLTSFNSLNEGAMIHDHLTHCTQI